MGADIRIDVRGWWCDLDQVGQMFNHFLQLSCEPCFSAFTDERYLTDLDLYLCVCHETLLLSYADLGPSTFHWSLVTNNFREGKRLAL